MQWSFASLKTVCEKLYFRFLDNRIRAELAGAGRFEGRRRDDSSEDPRKGGGLPVIGIL
jgi:hypothetical protein